MHHLSTATKLLAVAALPLALVACSSSSTSTKASASAGTKSAAAKDPNAGLLTGTQLKKALAPATYFPAGFASDSSATRDTGDSYSEPSVAAVSKPDCTRLDGTSWISLTGIDGVSFAQGDYINKNTSAEIAQEIDVYRGTTAKTVMGAVVKLASACPSFTDSQTSTKVKVSGHAEAGLGDEAYTITLTNSAWQSGTTLTAARVGTAVVSVLAGSGADNGAAAAKKLTSRVVSALNGKA